MVGEITRRGRGGPLTRLQDEMNDLFGRFFGESNLLWPERTFWPAVNVADKEDTVVVSVEVPGCKPGDIDISVHGNMLTISGEKREESQEKMKEYFHMESRYGAFRRELSLPCEVDPDKVDARCRDGIVTINLPKLERAKIKKITVHT